jgi:hypothetical protein
MRGPINGNLTCADCGSTNFKVNTVHYEYGKEKGRITMVELECAECAIEQIELDVDVPERLREFVKSTTYKDRGEE